MAHENIRIMCPALSCRKILAVPASSRGKNVRCKNCGATILIPDKSAPPPPPQQNAQQGAQQGAASHADQSNAEGQAKTKAA
jgi:hypothetical protein